MRFAVVVFWIAVVAAPFVSHIAIVTGRLRGAAVGFAALQAVAVGIVAWRSGGLVRIAGLTLAWVMLAVVGMRVAQPQSALGALLATSGVSHAVLYSSLLLLFGRTLQNGRRPLVTTLAIRMRDNMTPAMIEYTRSVTVAWCCFFAGQLVMSAVLLAWAPHAIWSLYVNVLDGLLVALMFAAEYGVRRLRFRHVAHVSPLAIIRRFSTDRQALDHG
jgi:uncharacterized membrane protein